MSRHQPFTAEEYHAIYSKVPKLCVEILLQTTQGVVLTLRQHKSWNNLWHYPGGSVFYREPVKEAVKRIAQEELGIDVTVGKQLGYLEFWSEEKERGFGYSVSLPFLCTTMDKLPKTNQEGEEIKVFDYVPENIVEEHRELLESILNKK